MKSVVAFVLLACSIAFAQPESCQPSALNIPGAPYPCLYPDHRIAFRVAAPDAQKVHVRLGGIHDMTRGADGLWEVTIPPQVVGFHYYSIVVDGAVMADPATRTFFGSGWDNSGIEIPAPDAALYAPTEVAHGDVRERWYFSKVTGKWRRCLVYTPPGYDINTHTRYPVLYLMHGWGENEQGWSNQGHVGFIMDNLIAGNKAKPMIIVMDNLNAVRPGNDDGLYTARSIIARRSLDKFAYLGGFSGSCGGRDTTFDPKTTCGGAFADPRTFNRKAKLLFLGIGAVEGPATKKFSDWLTQEGVHNVYFESPGTAHEWLTWRRCLYDFAPRLFR